MQALFNIYDLFTCKAVAERKICLEEKNNISKGRKENPAEAGSFPELGSDIYRSDDRKISDLEKISGEVKAQLFRNEIMALRLLLERCLKAGILLKGYTFLGFCM